MKRFSVLLIIACAIALSLCLFSCKGENKSITNQEAQDGVHVHEFTETVFAPTCQTKGYTNKVCTTCGQTTNYNYTSYINCIPTESWNVTREASCSSAGSRTRNCKMCSAVVETEVIPMLEHQPVTSVTRIPTCIEGGVEQTACAACKKVISTTTTEPTGNHNFLITTIAPTATTAGATIYKCQACSYTETGEYVEIVQGLTAQQIYSMAKNATVKVESYDKAGKRNTIGSGFFISEDGELVTNYHVIKNAYSLTVLTFNNERYNVSSILGYDKENDLAILKVEKTDTEYLQISVDTPKTGDRVYALGNPLNVENIFSTGIISNDGIIVNGIDCIAFTAPISPGNSGGPLLNENGEVIGINSMYIEEAQNLNFAIVASRIGMLNLDAEITPSEHYEQKISDNAFDLLTLYVYANSTSTEGEYVHVFYDELLENNDLVGLEYYYRFDEKSSLLTIEMIVVDAGQLQYSVFLEISSCDGEYKVSMYDYASKQTTVIAKLDATVKDEGFEASFENMFEFEKFRYDPDDAEKYQVRQEFFYAMYQGLIEHFSTFLANSYTGLDISHFKFA